MADDIEDDFIDLNDDSEAPVEEIATPGPAEETPARASRTRKKAAEAAPPAEDLDEDGTPRLHPILTNAELRAAQASARSKVEADRKAAAAKAVKDAEIERLKREEGLVTGSGPKDEMVSILIDLAEHSNRIVINQQAYHHGHRYTVPRHVADTLRDIMARGWEHQDEIDGKSKAQHYAAERQAQMKPVFVSGKTGANAGGLVNAGL